MSTIISLTSFGRRLEESAYRAICTLLDQTTPARVILYLDEGDEPTSKLRSLNDLEIVCGNENVGSYSKLVWALRDFPNDVIVTADDDIYYSRNWLSQLLEQHEKYPHKIIAHKAHSIAFRDGKIAPYQEWAKEVSDSPAIFPTGAGGILYPPGSLHSDVTNSELFLRLAPKADDIWFWAMAILQGTECAIVPDSDRSYHDVNGISWNGGTCLWKENVFYGGNDRQLQAVLAHYPKLQEWVQRNPKNGLPPRLP